MNDRPEATGDGTNTPNSTILLNYLNMKFVIATLLVGSAAAFAPAPVSRVSSEVVLLKDMMILQKDHG